MIKIKAYGCEADVFFSNVHPEVQVIRERMYVRPSQLDENYHIVESRRNEIAEYVALRIWEKYFRAAARLSMSPAQRAALDGLSTPKPIRVKQHAPYQYKTVTQEWQSLSDPPIQSPPMSPPAYMSQMQADLVKAQITSTSITAQLGGMVGVSWNEAGSDDDDDPLPDPEPDVEPQDLV